MSNPWTLRRPFEVVFRAVLFFVKGTGLLPALAVGTAVLTGPPARAQMFEFLETTELYDVQLGSSRYELARSHRSGGYELDEGKWQSFENWYTPDYPELNFKFSSPITSETSIIWGFSTGSAGEKFRIQPGFWVGFQHVAEISENVFFLMNAQTLLGGRLTEKTCEAGYDGVGNYTVNCRLAATELPPEATLDYLFGEEGWMERRAQVSVIWLF